MVLKLGIKTSGGEFGLFKHAEWAINMTTYFEIFREQKHLFIQVFFAFSASQISGFMRLGLQVVSFRP